MLDWVSVSVNITLLKNYIDVLISFYMFLSQNVILKWNLWEEKLECEISYHEQNLKKTFIVTNCMYLIQQGKGGMWYVFILIWKDEMFPINISQIHSFRYFQGGIYFVLFSLEILNTRILTNLSTIRIISQITNCTSIRIPFLNLLTTRWICL